MKIVRDAGEYPARHGAMAEIMEVKIFDLGFLLGSVKGFPESVLADRFTIAGKYNTGAVEAR